MARGYNSLAIARDRTHRPLDVDSWPVKFPRVMLIAEHNSTATNFCRWPRGTSKLWNGPNVHVHLHYYLLQ